MVEYLVLKCAIILWNNAYFTVTQNKWEKKCALRRKKIILIIFFYSLITEFKLLELKFNYCSYSFKILNENISYQMKHPIYCPNFRLPYHCQKYFLQNHLEYNNITNKFNMLRAELFIDLDKIPWKLNFFGFKIKLENFTIFKTFHKTIVYLLYKYLRKYHYYFSELTCLFAWKEVFNQSVLPALIYKAETWML